MLKINDLAAYLVIFFPLKVSLYYDEFDLQTIIYRAPEVNNGF